MIVIAASIRVPLTLVKFGPPESPKHVPPLPVDGFCDNRRKLLFKALKPENANIRGTGF